MSTATIDHRLGERIRALRVARGLTLDGLAARADVSRAMLSRIEHGASSPTAQLLAKICGGLGVTLSALFADAEAVTPLARFAAQPVWHDPDSGYLRRSVSPARQGGDAEITEVVFPPGQSVRFDNRRVAGAAQQVWVLDGVLELTVGGADVRLETGDCLAMRLSQPVRFHNPGARATRYAVIISHGEGTP